MTSEIVRSGPGGVHFRRMGKGRPVVLLHESPRSTDALMSLATALAGQGFTVFAFDTPGYGLSDPLPASWPEIQDFADAIADALRAVGFLNVPVYGTHTGATVATAMGVRHPELVSGIILDGYPVFDRTERDQHESFYLPQFPPAWDGSHVVALWARVRDQYEFFPWYTRGASTRLKRPRPDLAGHRAVFRDFLRSGPTYALAYGASFRFEATAWLSELKVPFHVMARDTDLLHAHLGRLPELNEWGDASSCESPPDVWTRHVAKIFSSMPGQEAAPGSVGAQADATGSLYTVGRQFFARNFGGGTSEPLVLLHDLPGSAKLIADEARRRSRDRLVIAPELPGCGISEQLLDGETGLEKFAELLGMVLDTNSVKTARIEGQGTAHEIAAAVAARSARFELGARAPLEAAQGVAPDESLPERWDGADLLALWYEVRERELARSRLSGGVAGLDTERMHATFVARCLSRGQLSPLAWRKD